jgi:hypothetical protein
MLRLSKTVVYKTTEIHQIKSFQFKNGGWKSPLPLVLLHVIIIGIEMKMREI